MDLWWEELELPEAMDVVRLSPRLGGAKVLCVETVREGSMDWTAEDVVMPRPGLVRVWYIAPPLD